jgi:hypothetical protein
LLFDFIANGAAQETFEGALRDLRSRAAPAINEFAIVWNPIGLEWLVVGRSRREKPLSAPEEMDVVLEKLPLRIGAYVPDDLLEDWFAPGTGMNPVSKEALAAAKAYGWRFECEFKHYPERMEGVFWKWVPAI